MTIYEYMIGKMIKNGLTPDQATEVMGIAMSAPSTHNVIGKWEDDITKYESMLITHLWFDVKKHGLRWIDANIPESYFRILFK